MVNYLKMHKRQQVISLLELGWSYRRIEAETGVRRETVSVYDRARRSNAAKVTTGSDANAAKVTAGSEAMATEVIAGSAPSRSLSARHHDTIVTKVDRGLDAQRIWQDLVADHDFPHGYESVKRYVRQVRSRRRRPVGVYVSGPGDEAQVDFFSGAPTLHPTTGRWRRPSVFRMTLCHSRHGYEEALWDQTLASFLTAHEHAFADFGGVPRVIRHDNLKSGVTRACLYDPDVNEVYRAFAEHWGFTPLPIRPRNPQENGKQERSGGYVKRNALKDRRFESLDDQNAYLRHWNRTIARLRIHGTTKKQVWAHFIETDRPALGPLAPTPFALFTSVTRKVHADGHVQVAGAFYPVPVHLMGQRVRVRYDPHLVRVLDDTSTIAVYARVRPGCYASRPGGGDESADGTHAQTAFVDRLLARCDRVGAALRAWADDALEERGVRAIRLIQGALSLTRSYEREHVLHAATIAREERRFRYRELKALAAHAASQTSPRRPLKTTDPDIRSMINYRLDEVTE